MLFKKFLPKKDNENQRIHPLRTVIASVLIAVLLVSTSVGLGLARFRLVSRPLTTEVKTTGLRVDNDWAVVKERVSGEDTVFSFLDGDIKVTVPSSAEGDALDGAKYLVLTHQDYKPSYSDEDGYKIKFTLSAYHFADANDDTVTAIEAVDDTNSSMSIAFFVDDASVEDATDGYTGPDEDGYVIYSGVSSFEDAAYEVKYQTGDTWVDMADTDWYDDEETDFEISSAAELGGLAKLVNEGEDFEGCTITLADDIDLDEKEWIPIGTASNPFMGAFDGDGYTISNMNIVSVEEEDNSDDDSAGLFGTIDGATVKNVTLFDADISVDLGSDWDPDFPSSDPSLEGSAIGAAVGRSIGGNISNVHVNSLSITGSAKYVGGILGFGNDGGSVSGCSVQSANIAPADAQIVGGIAGAPSNVSDCYVSATLGGSYTACGGIAGLASGSASSMTGCYFTGSIADSTDSIKAGMLAVLDYGVSNHKFTFENCYADVDFDNKIFGATNSNFDEEAAAAAIITDGEYRVDWKNSGEEGQQTWTSAGGTEYTIVADHTSYSSGMTYEEFKNA